MHRRGEDHPLLPSWCCTAEEKISLFEQPNGAQIDSQLISPGEVLNATAVQQNEWLRMEKSHGARSWIRYARASCFTKVAELYESKRLLCLAPTSFESLEGRYATDAPQSIMAAPLPISLAAMDKQLVEEHYTSLQEWREFYRRLETQKEEDRKQRKVEELLGTRDLAAEEERAHRQVGREAGSCGSAGSFCGYVRHCDGSTMLLGYVMGVDSFGSLGGGEMGRLTFAFGGIRELGVGVRDLISGARRNSRREWMNGVFVVFSAERSTRFQFLKVFPHFTKFVVLLLYGNSSGCGWYRWHLSGESDAVVQSRLHHAFQIRPHFGMRNVVVRRVPRGSAVGLRALMVRALIRISPPSYKNTAVRELDLHLRPRAGTLLAHTSVYFVGSNFPKLRRDDIFSLPPQT